MYVVKKMSVSKKSELPIIKSNKVLFSWFVKFFNLFDYNFYLKIYKKHRILDYYKQSEFWAILYFPFLCKNEIQKFS